VKSNLPLLLRLKKKIKKSKVITVCITKRNVIINLARGDGTTLQRFSAGTEGYKDAKKRMAIARRGIARSISYKLKQRHLNKALLKFTGNARHRRHILRGLRTNGLRLIGRIMDTKLLPHNGCRKKSRKRR
jgi:ribosomal protein S11